MNLKPKDRLFINAYLETGSASQAAIACGYKGKNAAVRGWQIMKRLNHPLNLLMAECGLTSLAILRNVANGMNAEDVHLHYDSEGKVRQIKTPNWSARARFTDMAIRLAGGYPKQQMELPFEIKDGKMVITAEFATHTEMKEAA
ncbi:hypothetical protein AAU61_14400 [Desulfocarbo indianensis]|nr:hypothetical protein AAU61_14400 [Desulfocarbo indianensis]